MKIVKLGEIATVSLSNVDKKSKPNQKNVLLCNFVDVYHNWAITEYNKKDFLIATANDNEINRFTLKKGDVAITKDSETRDDIGISAYIAEDIEDLILGYHTALIRPNGDILLGKYLNIVLHSPLAQKYFEYNASGSGQRYTLTLETIQNFPVPLPNIDDQKQLGALCSNIDRKINNNKSIISELESMAKTLYDYWFLQFEFPNKEGKPYKSSGGKMVWNEELKRYIPEGWETCKIIDICDLYQPKTISEKDLISNGKYFVYGANGIVGKYDKYNHCDSEIAICCRGASCGSFIMTTPYSWITGNAMVIKPFNDSFKEYIFYGLNELTISKYITGSAQPQITRTNLSNMVIVKPDAVILNKFKQFSANIREKLLELFDENQQLTSLRDFLLPMLMNGQVTFKKEGESIA